jgi:hypothetical protein
MSAADLSPPAPAGLDLAALHAENTKLRERLESAEHYTAHTQFDAEIVDALLEQARAAQTAA